MTKESLWYAEILLALILVHVFCDPAQRYIGVKLLPGTLVHHFCSFRQIGTIVATTHGQGGMVGGCPHACGQTLCSNVCIFWLYHPPSRSENDRCSPMCGCYHPCIVVQGGRHITVLAGCVNQDKKTESKNCQVEWRKVKIKTAHPHSIFHHQGEMSTQAREGKVRNPSSLHFQGKGHVRGHKS